jgi:hypothetical protein
VVISRPSSLDTRWGRNIPWGDFDPVVLLGLAFNLVVLSGGESILSLAFPSALDVLRFLLVERAP